MPTLLATYQAIRSATESLAARLSAEDQMVQSCPEASPTKWHQAHTTWFFETFILLPFLADHKPFHRDFRRLFNSYYNSLGEPIPDKASRSSLSRPSLDEVLAYRRYVDHAMERVLADVDHPELERRVVLGLNHEQQHQELILTDIKHAFFSNPLRPPYCSTTVQASNHAESQPYTWHEFRGGVMEIGHSPDPADAMDFCFDNETPRHKVYIESFKLASRAVTCREYLGFIADHGYARPEFWLAEGWDTIRRECWQSPLYWEHDSTDAAGWRVFTLKGSQPLSSLMETSVCHVSYFEADAFARWSGVRLPTEPEWEIAALRGQQLCRDGWEWTASPYTAYPGYQAPPGAFGEYNGKFMSSQMILRGGSCVTPASHIRPTYRNFFPPATRWQVSGIRLASNTGEPS